MIIDQAEIDALLKGASQEAAPEPPKAPPPAPKPAPPAPPAKNSGNQQLARILRLRVPAVVVLAKRRMHVNEVRRLSLSSIIEFEKAITDQLELHINRVTIARGEAVKVGENFGLRINEIDELPHRINSLGPGK